MTEQFAATDGLLYCITIADDGQEITIERDGMRIPR